ncbi:MAG TPA: CPBP family glutamic-type intramembrane protease [Candidatus Nitrosopolaris sp.]|nr:CPBP family glutamic-type intramembrane protease [Candidatus Nitrosopolaris sp.]
MTNLELTAHRRKAKPILISLYVYVVWSIVTYLLEGRIHLLQRADVVGRIEYVVIANMVIGTVLAIWLLRYYHISSDFISTRKLGFQSVNRRFWVVVGIASVIGFVLFIFQGPVSLNPVVISNVFAQTLPTSIAEVVVCWVVVGASIESQVLAKGKHEFGNGKMTKNITAAIIGAVVATILFGVYHFAHSPPFNQANTVLFLMIPGALTGVVFFVGRNIYAALIFHNFQALFGVMRSIDITSYTHPIYPLLIMGLVSILILIAADVFFARRKIGTTKAAR